MVNYFIERINKLILSSIFTCQQFNPLFIHLACNENRRKVRDVFSMSILVNEGKRKTRFKEPNIHRITIANCI